MAERHAYIGLNSRPI